MKNSSAFIIYLIIIWSSLNVLHGCKGVINTEKIFQIDQGYVVGLLSNYYSENILIKINPNDSRDYKILARFDIYTGYGAKVSPNDSLICFLAKPYVGDDAAVALCEFNCNTFNLIEPKTYGQRLFWNTSGDRLYIESGDAFSSSIKYYSFVNNKNYLLPKGGNSHIIQFVHDSLMLVISNLKLGYMNADGDSLQLIENEFQYPNLSPKPYDRESISTSFPYYQDYCNNKLVGTTNWSENGKTYISIIETDIEGTYFKYITKKQERCRQPLWGQNGNLVFYQIEDDEYEWTYKVETISGRTGPLLDFDLFPDFKYLIAFEFRTTKEY